MIKKTLIFGIMTALIFLGSFMLHHNKVYALTSTLCDHTPLNIGGQSLAYCQGYFNGSNHNDYYNVHNSHQVISTGIGNTSQSGFEDEIHCYLYNDTTDSFCAPWKATYGAQNQTGAAFIVDAMLEHAPFNSTVAAGINFAAANNNFTNWMTLVNTFYTGSMAGYSVTTTGPVCVIGSMNSAYFDGYTDNNGDFQPADDALHVSDCGKNNTGLDRSPLLIFTSPGGNKFEIGTLCGNIEISASVKQLQQQVLSCSISTTPAQVDQATAFTATVTVSSSNGPPPANLLVTLSSNPSTTINPNPPSQTTNGQNQANFTVGPTNSTGTYALTATLAGGTTCPYNVIIANYPYLQVYGGDVSVTGSPDIQSNGSSNAPSANCESNPSAGGIFSWNNNGTPNYTGAGSQYAVYALGQIDGFASDQEGSAPQVPPTFLSFAYPQGSSGPYGGSFGANSTSANCDFTYDCLFQSVDNNAITPGCPNNNPLCNVTCNNIPTVINNGVSRTIFTLGSVYIDHNVTYEPGPWANPRQIPYFRLVVIGGNIYLGPDVTELDGIYVAEPSNINGGPWTGGTIYTCSYLTGALSRRNLPKVNPTGANGIPNYDTTCTKPLSIYGSFVAQQVEFLRTHGTLGGANTSVNNSSCMVIVPALTGTNSCNSAETFDYTPEVWLPRTTGQPSDTYTSITSLPPIL
jgi:hypothetical protein